MIAVRSHQEKTVEPVDHASGVETPKGPVGGGQVKPIAREFEENGRETFLIILLRALGAIHC
jgi:hypothetical protein